MLLGKIGHNLSKSWRFFARAGRRKANRAEGFPLEERSVEGMARWLESVQHPTLTSRARERIWRMALERAEQKAAPARSRRSLLLRPAWVALPLALVLAFSSFGVILAAQDSLPTDPLYPVKRFSEQVWFSLTRESRRPAVALELALRRLEEVEQLTQQSQPVPADVLDNLETQLLLIEQASGSEWGQEQALAHLQRHIQVLEQQVALHPMNTGLLRALSASRRAQKVLSGEPSTPAVPEDTVTTPGRDHNPPGQEQTPPGQEHTPPGQEQTPPGQEQTPPGQEQIPPGQEQTPPGPEHTPPGQEQTPPGQGQTPPGQEQTPPGQEQTPPGQEQTPPGQGQTPPGQGHGRGGKH